MLFGVWTREALGILLLFSVSLGLWSCSLLNEDQPEAEAELSHTSWSNWLRKDELAGMKQGEVPEYPNRELEDASLFRRGEYLVRKAGACVYCHGSWSLQEAQFDQQEVLAGGRPLRDSFGAVTAPNITPDEETGIGGWSVPEVVSAIRASIGKEGRPLSLEHHGAYRWMADEDARAIAVFLLKQEPVSHQVERRELGLFEKNALGILARHEPTKGYVPRFVEAETYHYGRYLAENVSACSTCHFETPIWGDGKPLAGVSKKGRTRSEALQLIQDGEVPVQGPSIRGGESEALESWSASDVAQYLNTGQTPSGETVPSELCPWPWYAMMKSSDKQAIGEYLKRLD